MSDEASGDDAGEASGGGLRSCLGGVGRLIWRLLCPTAAVLNALNEKFDAQNEKFDAQNEKFDAQNETLNEKFNALNEKLDGVLNHILRGTPSNTTDVANPSSEDTRRDDETNTEQPDGSFDRQELVAAGGESHEENGNINGTEELERLEYSPPSSSSSCSLSETLRGEIIADSAEEDSEETCNPYGNSINIEIWLL